MDCFLNLTYELNDEKAVYYPLIVTIFPLIIPKGFPFIFIPKKALFFDLERI
jgi:hypothetical protein